MAATIDEANQPKEMESHRMKRAKTLKDPRLSTRIPTILAEAENAGNAGNTSSGSRDTPGPTTVFRPAWGIRNQDTIVGDTKHAMDWSLISITPHDYQDCVLRSDFERAVLLGSQAQAAVCSFTL